MFTCKPYEVDADMPIFPASEDEPVVLEHLLVEPGCKEDWVSGLLDLDAFQIEKNFNIEDISCTFEYDQIKLDTDAVQTKLTKGEGKSPEFPSEVSQETEIGGCDEYHFDSNHADKAHRLDTGSCKESSCLGNVGLENECQSVHKIDSGELLVKLSSTCISGRKDTNNHHSLLDQAAANELDEAFKNISGHETLLIDKNWQKKHDLYGLENYVGFDGGLNLMKFEEMSTESDGKTVFSSIVDYCASSTHPVTGSLNDKSISGEQQMKRKRVDGCESLKTSTSDVTKIEFCSLDEVDRPEPLVSPKRSRKPPKRYIEESLEYESKSSNKKCGIGKRSKDRILHDRYPKYKWQNAEQVVYEDDSFNGGCIQVPFGLPMEKELPHPKKNKPSLVRSSEESKDNRLLEQSERLEIEPLLLESPEDFSEDECVARSYTAKGSSRRKRHISWTTEEVVKLVDGVSQCGVGRWTEIKRLLFSSSSHRTSVDLKDKWRNLLRASCAQLQIKEKVEQGRKQATNFVPESILWRVRELAVIYPYPRESRSKVSCTVPAVSSFPARTSNALVPLSTAV